MNLILSPGGIAIITIAANGIVYKLLNRRISKWYPAHAWDQKIPLVSAWVFPYIGYYFFVGYSFLLFSLQRIGPPFIVSYGLGTLIAAVLWYIFPTGVKRPKPLDTRSTSARLLNHLYTHDGDTNAAPSGHVLHTVICGYYLWLAAPQYHVPILVLASLIIVSTVLIKQHYLFDVLLGLLVGTISVVLGEGIV